MTYSYSLQLGTMAVIMQTIENSLEYPVKQESFAILHLLSKKALNIPRPINFASGPSKGQPILGFPNVDDNIVRSLVQYGQQVNNRGLTILATAIIYSRPTLRMLSCARPTSSTRQDVGWRTMYLD